MPPSDQTAPAVPVPVKAWMSDKDQEAPAEKPKLVEERVSICKLLSLAKPWEILVLAIGIVGCVGAGAGRPVMTLLFGNLIDGLGTSATAKYQGGGIDMSKFMSQVTNLCARMCYIGLMQVACSSLQGACFKILSDSQAAKLRVLYFDSVLHQDITWFDTREVAQLPLQISDDMDKVAEALGDKLGQTIMATCGFISGYVFAFVAGWQVALVLLSILPLLGLGAVVRGRAMRGQVLEIQDWYAKAGGVVEECLYAMRTVVSFGGEKRELAKYNAAVQEARKGGIRNGFKLGAATGYTTLVSFLGYALAFYYGMTLRYNGTINPATGTEYTPGSIMSVFFCVFMGTFNLGAIDPGLKAVQAGRVSAARIFKALEAPMQIQCRGEDHRQKITEIETLALQDVFFNYPARPEVQVLKGLSLTMKRGQRVAVVGESGSGKSTVMALLERFYDPISGLVLVNGVDMKSIAVRSLRRCIGYVGQEPVLFATTIRDNIMQGFPEASEAELMRAVKDAQLNFVDVLPEGLDTFVGSGGSQFSGGQKQRIAIARALIKRASFLFLDEATSALDNTSEKMIQATIEHISNSQASGLGIISIAHRLSTVRNCDVIYVLNHGVLAEQGNHESLMASRGLYYALAASQESAIASEPEKVSEAVQRYQVEEAEGEEDQSPVRARADPPNLKAQKDDEEAERKKREKEFAKKYKVPMRRLLSYCKPEWFFFVPSILGAIGEGAAMPVASILLTHSMNSFFKPKDDMRKDLELTCLVFVIVGVAQLLATVVEWGSFAVLGESMTKRLRVAMLTTMFRQEIGFHDDPENTPGTLAKALELYTFRVSSFIKTIGAEAAAITSVLVGLGISFFYCWQMSLVMLAAVPILIGASAVQNLFLLGAAKKENDLLKKAQQIISDSVQNARTVQACGNERELVGLYEGIVNKTLVGFVKRNVLAGIAYGFASGSALFISAGGFAFAADLVTKGQADFLGVMTAFMGIIYAGMGAGRVAVVAGDGTKAKVACNDMFQILDRISKIDGLQPTGETPSTELRAGTIEFQNVKFFYPFRAQVQVLKGINFKVKAGTSVGLVGPSGGGKSTVMALIQRFYDPVEGFVLLGEEGVNLASLNIRWWRRQVGFVGQEPILFNTTVRNNVLYGLEDGEKISDEYLEACKKMAHLDFLDTKEAKGLDTEVGPRGSRLSGGQKQRVAICRALIRNPALLLLDEATSALDTQSERVVQEALENARKGRTSFAIAHRLSTISGCDTILVVAEGVILEQGNHDELMQLQGVYHKLQVQASK